MAEKLSRRRVIGVSGGLAALAACGTIEQPATEAGPAATAKRKLKVVVVGGHPDDPESGCCGTIARYVAEGHEVVCLYLTRGEAGIRGKGHEEAAAIRTAEATAACKLLGAKPLFAGQIDGATEVNASRYAEFNKLLSDLEPDIVFTHWPIDSHRDHRAASLLVYDAWLRAGKRFALYYYEVLSGAQTQQYRPTHYVDITKTVELKRKALFCHASQRPDRIWAYHEQMDRFRGLECRRKAAEAFVRHVQDSTALVF
jgi:LmbE family N-acetylglucosaminyl deacetylase